MPFHHNHPLCITHRELTKDIEEIQEGKWDEEIRAEFGSPPPDGSTEDATMQSIEATLHSNVPTLDGSQSTAETGRAVFANEVCTLFLDSFGALHSAIFAARYLCTECVQDTETRVAVGSINPALNNNEDEYDSEAPIAPIYVHPRNTPPHNATLTLDSQVEPIESSSSSTSANRVCEVDCLCDTACNPS